MRPWCLKPDHSRGPRFTSTLSPPPSPLFVLTATVADNKDHYKLALGQLSTARHLIDSLGKEYVRLLKFGDSLYRCKTLKVSLRLLTMVIAGFLVDGRASCSAEPRRRCGQPAACSRTHDAQTLTHHIANRFPPPLIFWLTARGAGSHDDDCEEAEGIAGLP